MKNNIYWVSGNFMDCVGTLNHIKKNNKFVKITSLSEDNSVDEFKNAILEEDCFDEKNLIVISTMPTGKTFSKNILPVLQKSSDNNIILFYRTNLELVSYKDIHSFVIDECNWKTFQSSLLPSEAKYYVIDRIKSFDKTISPENAQMLINLDGYAKENYNVDIDLINSCIKKLVLANNGQEITTASIFDSSLGNEKSTSWEFFGSLDNKNIDSSYSLYISLLNKENSDDFYSKILNLMLWRYKIILFIKSYIMNNKECNTESIKKHIVESFIKEEDKPMYTPHSISGFFKNCQNISIAENYSVEEISTVISLLNFMILETRTNATNIDISVYFSLLISYICGCIPKNTIVKIIKRDINE